MTTIAEQQTDLQQAESKLEEYRRKLRSAEESGNARLQDKFLEYIGAWKQAIGLVKSGYSYSTVSTWATATATGEFQRGQEVLRIEEAEMEARRIAEAEATAGMSDTERFQYESFIRQGYSQTEASTLTAWSSKHMKSPSPETAKRIIAGDVTPYYETSIAPTPTLTPRAQFFELMGLEKKESPFGLDGGYRLPEKAPAIPEAKVTQLGGIFFTPEEAEKRGIAITEGYGFLPTKEIKPTTPLITYAPEKTEKYFKSFLAEPSTITEVDIRKYEQETSYKELFKKGMFSSIIRKSFRDFGTAYFGGVAGVIKPVFPLSESQIKRGGVILGESALFYGFSPAMTTGTASLQEVLSKSKLSELGKELTRGKVGKIEKELIKKTLKEQLKYLKKIKSELKTPEAIKGFEEFTRELVKKEIIKLPTYKIGAPTTQTIKVSIQIPEMKEIGALVGGAPALKELLKSFEIKEKPEIDLTKTRFDLDQEAITKTKQKVIVTPKEKFKQLSAPKLKAPQLEKQFPKQKPISKQIPKQAPIIKVITKQIPKTKQVPRFKFPFPKIPMKPKPTERGFPFLPLFLRPWKLESRRRIIRVRRIIPPTKYRPSFVALGLGIKARKIPKAYFRGAGGLIVRPIITPRRKKK